MFWQTGHKLDKLVLRLKSIYLKSKFYLFDLLEILFTSQYLKVLTMNLTSLF